MDLGHFALDNVLSCGQLHDYAKFASGWIPQLRNIKAESLPHSCLSLTEVVVLAHTTEVPAFGTLKAANLDLQHWALVWLYVNSCDNATFEDPKTLELQMIRKSLLYYPVTFEFIPVAPDNGVQVFRRCFQLMENLTIDKDANALTGWEILRTWDNARNLSKVHYVDDPDAGVDIIFGGINFAESSEYKTKKQKHGGRDEKTLGC